MASVSKKARFLCDSGEMTRFGVVKLRTRVIIVEKILSDTDYRALSRSDAVILSDKHYETRSQLTKSIKTRRAYETLYQPKYLFHIDKHEQHLRREDPPSLGQERQVPPVFLGETG
jgi:hypothetical protein